MDNSKKFELMLDRAIGVCPEGFARFDRTKNVQDQLQEIYTSFSNENILNDEYAPLSSIELAENFNMWLETFTKKEPYSWFNNPTDIRGWVSPSMEQLWLAFVMKKRYSKVWNGKDWIEAK